MARNTMACHVEQFPTGTYERCHRHGPGSTIILLDGSGFSMMWPREIGTTPFKDAKQEQVKQFDWKEGTLVVPPLQWFHQHFNSGKTPARFVKLGGWNNDLYPFTTTWCPIPAAQKSTIRMKTRGSGRFSRAIGRHGRAVQDARERVQERIEKSMVPRAPLNMW